MSKSENYGRYAAQCFNVAETALSKHERLFLIEMAETWRRLAEQSESGEKLQSTVVGIEADPGA